MITIEQIKKIVKPGWGVDHRDSLARELLPEINEFLDFYEFDEEETVLFLGNCIFECGYFHRVEERYVADGYNKPGEQYEGRSSLGNTEEGDGARFIGRGMIQVTGRRNYKTFADHVQDPAIMDDPKMLFNDPGYAVQSAFWYWRIWEAEDTGNTCSEVANNDFEELSMEERCYRVSAIINRGEEKPRKEARDMGERIACTKRACDALGVDWD